MPYSEVLKQEYDFRDGKVTFADGTQYSVAEMSALKGADPVELRAIHAIKRAFGGRITPRQER